MKRKYQILIIMGVFILILGSLAALYGETILKNEPETYVISVNPTLLAINVVAEPNINAPMVARIFPHVQYKFLVLEETDEWLKIFLDKDTVGWVPRFMVNTVSEPEE